eukprot:1162113-Pelagomonas_calceolata.AAC.3
MVGIVPRIDLVHALPAVLKPKQGIMHKQRLREQRQKRPCGPEQQRAVDQLRLHALAGELIAQTMSWYVNKALIGWWAVAHRADHFLVFWSVSAQSSSGTNSQESVLQALLHASTVIAKNISYFTKLLCPDQSILASDIFFPPSSFCLLVPVSFRYNQLSDCSV